MIVNQFQINNLTAGILILGLYHVDVIPRRVLLKWTFQYL